MIWTTQVKRRDSRRARRPGRVTIETVAARANVSVTTVSHALNGKGRVKPATRQRILEIAEALGYVANPQARALKTGSTMTLLAELPGSRNTTSLHGAFVSDVLIGAATRALEAGYLLTVAGHDSRPPDAAFADRYDGALIVDPPQRGGSILPLLERQIPVVTIGRADDQAEAGWVDNDYSHGVMTVLSHLHAVGYRRPAILTTRARVSYAKASISAYRTWAKANAVSPVIQYVSGYPDVERGRAATERLLSSDDRPDAIIGTTEPLTVGAMRAIQALGLRSPEEVGLASIHDSERLRAAVVPITALDLRASELGRQALDLLIQAVDDPGAAQSSWRVVPTELVIRQSTQRQSSSLAS
jgi:DNA-binding LacI/PurR family transcriptional regulator